MKTTKKLKISLGVIACFIATATMVLTACEEDEEKVRNRAEEAAEEMCDCIRIKSVSKCEDELKKNYSGYLNQKFVDLFNEVQTCGVTLKIEYIKGGTRSAEEIITLNP